MSGKAFFKMSDAILDCPCALELAQCERGDGDAGARLHLFIQLLCFALYPSKAFVNAAALARFSGASPKQAARVWETCLRHGVLRESGHGYSAREWLIEQGYLGRADAPAKTPKGDDERPRKEKKKDSWSFQEAYFQQLYGDLK